MSSPAAQETRRAAREFGGRVSAAAALGVALVSLLQHAPLWLASLRGLATLLVLGFGTRLGAAVLARAVDFDRERARPKQEPKR